MKLRQLNKTWSLHCEWRGLLDLALHAVHMYYDGNYYSLALGPVQFVVTDTDYERKGT